MPKKMLCFFFFGLLLLILATWNRIASANLSPEMAVANQAPPGEGKYNFSFTDVFTDMFSTWAAQKAGEEWKWQEEDNAIYRLAIMKNNQAIIKERALKEITTKITALQLEIANLTSLRDAQTPPEDLGVDDGDDIQEPNMDSEPMTIDENSDPTVDTSVATEDTNTITIDNILEKDQALQTLNEEYKKLAQFLAKYDLVKEKDRVCDVAVLNNGSVLAVRKLLALCGRPVRLVESTARFSFLAKETPLLIIPSGGLSNIMQRWQLQGQLNGFVGNGGTVICLAQRRRADYAMLPGSPGVYGWLETQSDTISKNVSVVNLHPITTALTEAIFEAAVDGFIYKYPKEGKILLRSNINGQPVNVTYKQKKGNVLVTTLFSDWLYSTGRIGNEEMKFFRSMVNWGISGANSYRETGSSEKLLCEIHNQVKTMSKSIVFYMLSPSNKPAYNFSVKRNILPGETEQVEIQMTMPSAGIWQLTYTLLDESGQEIQGMKHLQYIATGSLKMPVLSDVIGYALTSSSEYVSKGKGTRLTLHLWNMNPNPQDLQTIDPTRVKTTIKLKSAEYKQISLNIPGERVIYNQTFFNYQIFDNTGQVLAQIFKTCFGVGK